MNPTENQKEKSITEHLNYRDFFARQHELDTFFNQLSGYCYVFGKNIEKTKRRLTEEEESDYFGDLLTEEGKRTEYHQMLKEDLENVDEIKKTQKLLEEIAVLQQQMELDKLMATFSKVVIEGKLGQI